MHYCGQWREQLVLDIPCTSGSAQSFKEAAGALCSQRGNTVTVKMFKGTNFVNGYCFLL